MYTHIYVCMYIHIHIHIYIYIEREGESALSLASAVRQGGAVENASFEASSTPSFELGGQVSDSNSQGKLRSQVSNPPCPRAASVSPSHRRGTLKGVPRKGYFQVTLK